MVQREQICFTEKRFFYWVKDNTSVSLRAKSGSYGGGSETLITDAIGFDSYNQQATGETSKPLTNKATDTDHTPVIAQSAWDGSQTAPTLTGRNAGGGQRMPDKENFNAVISDYVVRRLTPTECERLQAFPDGWTDIGEWTDTNGKKHTTADSARYKALGNSICTAAWVDILQSIAERIPEGEEKTMASLFDGIGGFPLIWERDCGGKTVWASEIEEFCIAVTERRFNEDRSLIGSRSQAVNVERERERERVGLLHRERTTARCNDPERGNEQDSELLGRPDEGADISKKRVFDNRATDARITECGETAFTVAARYGTGGNNQPIVLEEG